jgi:hypothetical protein
MHYRYENVMANGHRCRAFATFAAFETFVPFVLPIFARNHLPMQKRSKMLASRSSDVRLPVTS